MMKQRWVHLSLTVLLIVMMLSACASGYDTLNPTAAALPEAAMPLYQPRISIPAELHLSGALIIADYHRGIFRLDLSTQALTHIFNPPPESFLSSAVLSPDGQTFALVFSPPRDSGDLLYGIPSIYTLPANGSGEPKPLLGEPRSGNYYFSPWWSPDGEYLYYGHLVSPPLSGAPTAEPTGCFLTRYRFSDGAAQDLLRNVLALRLSTDGTKLVYISLDPTTTLNNLYVAETDGNNAQSLLPGGESWIIDSLTVAPDGERVVFSNGNNPTAQSSTSWWEQLTGVSVAQVQVVPSDLWIVQAGESPRQLTNLANNAFIEDFSPDGQYIAFACGPGIYVMRPDGTGLTPIVSETVFASLQWIP